MDFKAITFILTIACISSYTQFTKIEQEYFDEALSNGIPVNEGYNRCLHYVKDWLTYADSTTGFIQ